MAKRSNQEIEQYYFGMFRRDYKLPEGMIVHGDKPDVILEGKRKIGIEITNFFLESGALSESEQVQRKAREAVVSEAQKIYLANGGKSIELSVSFDKLSPIRDKRKLTKKIAAAAKNNGGLKTGEIRKDFFKDIPELSFVYLNAKEYEDPKWRGVQCFSGHLMSEGKLRPLGRGKDAPPGFFYQL